MSNSKGFKCGSKSARAGNSDSNLASFLISGRKSQHSISKQPSAFIVTSNTEVLTGFKKPKTKEYLTVSVLGSKAKIARVSPQNRRHDTGVKESSSVDDFSFETEKIEDEPQPNFSEFEWIRPID